MKSVDLLIIKRYYIYNRPLDGSNNFYQIFHILALQLQLKNGEIIAGFVANMANKTLVYRILNDEVKYFVWKIKEEIQKSSIIFQKLQFLKEDINIQIFVKI